ncbi:anhydro-N-acetylmuramic acid kinase [Aliihoeflea aestuarii]|jgi:anhydro-N-acetylmuramic acid kinase|uniref:anhydro-N-acetylmuramic acid kinase n=1 Tax=Aliihoeflea aestuarii TaxID=453840 RepID=UPI0020965858|nr:anhydro-N-acetylmuramic acid kinase [Aliihoeflea aestuarii]MCO6393229.1 anhydro-N-acetylmuramic acid kinase [Aliihoeflea aestuarii]
MALTRALGLMSGTSMDGIDLALVDTDGDTAVSRGPAMFVAYDAVFRRRIEAGLEEAKSIDSRDERPGDLAGLEHELTMRHVSAVAAFVEKHGAVDLIGFHGQTVLHRPERALTVQLGDGALLARETGIPVVYDMRAADMEAGGQGAPLVPAYHAALAALLNGVERPVCFVNVGGISNITFVAADGPPVAFDSGPGNALIDQWVSREGGVPFDQNGMIASEGGIVTGVVKRYLKNPFFERTGPKSLDRNDFTLELAAGLELADGARTLATVSAAAIVKAAQHLPSEPKVWILCGGGRKNPHIVADMRIEAEKRGAQVLLAEDVGLDGDSMEAEAWAYLAVRAKKRLPFTWPTTTGCRVPVTGGVLVSP